MLPQHRRAVIERLRSALVAGETPTRSDLGSDTRLSGAILGRVLIDLEHRGLIERTVASDPHARGLKARYRLVAARGRALVFGFGHDRLGVAVVELSGAVREGGDHIRQARTESGIDDEPTWALQQASALAARALEETETGPEHLVGIGVSMPAPLMEDGRLYAGFMDAWQGRNLSDELRELLGLHDLPVALEKDANLVALREHRAGAAREVADACIVKWGAGLSAGLIVDGRLHRGPRGLAGEIGHVLSTAGLGDPTPDETLDLFQVRPADSRVCPRCGLACIEDLIGSRGLGSYLQAKGYEFESIPRAIEAGLNGHQVVRGAFRRAAHLLGHKLGPIVSALNLQRVILDCFADQRAFQLVVDGFNEGLRHRMTAAAYQQVTVVPASFGQKAAILGAADLVFDNFLGEWARRLPNTVTT